MISFKDKKVVTEAEAETGLLATDVIKQGAEKLVTAILEHRETIQQTKDWKQGG